MLAQGLNDSLEMNEENSQECYGGGQWLGAGGFLYMKEKVIEFQPILHWPKFKVGYSFK